MDKKILNDAISHLKKDNILKVVIDKTGKLEWSQQTDLFADLVESIINQQLSVKAASTIFGRFKGLFGGNFPTPEQILTKTDDGIRSCGISFAKIKYIKGLAQMVLYGDLKFEKIKDLPDEIVIEELLKIKGVGRWTAEMTLMFFFNRPDVFSMGDAGLMRALKVLYGIDGSELEKIQTITDKWKPYRTIACRYLWKSLDNEK